MTENRLKGSKVDENRRKTHAKSPKIGFGDFAWKVGWKTPNKEHKSFCPGTRPGRPVTGVTGQSFIRQSFMCLFCQLLGNNLGCSRVCSETFRTSRRILWEVICLGLRVFKVTTIAMPLWRLPPSEAKKKKTSNWAAEFSKAGNVAP